ncbi:MAG: hypothetical protein ABSA76_13765 [Bacteroidales bacterium]
MQKKRTLNNLLLIKLDPENDSIKLRNGFELYVDNTFEPEKHATVTGEIYGIPDYLYYSGMPNIGLPWKTELEVQMGDHVIMYYLSVLNALNVDKQNYLIEGNDKYVFIPYQNIFAVVREKTIIPINGYNLIEPSEDPDILRQRGRMESIGMIYARLKEKSNTNVVYGIVRYVGKPNKAYVDSEYTDDGVDISIGDTVVMKKITDIPLQYNLHAKIDDGKLYWRVQRRNIMAKL